MRPNIESVTDLATERPWQHSGQFFGAVAQAGVSRGGVIDPRLYAGTPSGSNQKLPSEGGFLAPPTIAQGIWNGLNADPLALLPRTDSYIVSGESELFPAVAQDSQVAGSLYGGITAYFLSEADQATKSKPKFRGARVEPYEMVALCYGTDKLVSNAGPALGQFLTRAAAAAINHRINQALIEGNGAGQPLGLLNSPCAIQVAKESGQAAATVLPANAAKMWARLHPIARQNAVWLHHTSVETALDTLTTVVRNQADSDNVGGTAPKIYDAEKRTLKGRPMIESDFCSVLGTVGDLILVDLRSYLTGTRGSVEEAMSIHVRFDYGETAFRFKFAVDGQPWLGSAITPSKGSDTLSTVITLQTR